MRCSSRRRLLAFLYDRMKLMLSERCASMMVPRYLYSVAQLLVPLDRS